MITFNSIRFKLFILFFIPLVFFLILGLNLIQGKKTVMDDMSDTLDLANLSIKLSSILHETQKERGATGVFLGSNGKKFVAEMSDQRKMAGQKIRDFHDFLTGFNPDDHGEELSRRLGEVQGRLGDLSSLRKEVDALSLSADRALAEYTELNGMILDLINTTTLKTDDVIMARLQAGYINFLQGKERAEIERAVMAKTFSGDMFPPGGFNRFSELVTTQKIYFDVFKAIASPEQVGFFKDKMNAPAVADVEKMRARAYEMGVLKTPVSESSRPTGSRP